MQALRDCRNMQAELACYGSCSPAAAAQQSEDGRIGDNSAGLGQHLGHGLAPRNLVAAHLTLVLVGRHGFVLPSLIIGQL
jgi:hypothetical protein